MYHYINFFSSDVSQGEKYHIYCDDGKSGKDIEHRPDFQRMMSDARNGLIKRIVVKKYDHFSRNMFHVQTLQNSAGYFASCVPLLLRC